MSNLRENLMSANLLARIESLIGVMKSNGSKDWDVNEKKWFAELLSPFSGSSPENCHLVPSPNLSPYEGGIILEMISRELARDNINEKNLNSWIKSLVKLYMKLTTENPQIDENDKKKILELAIEIRRHMIDSVPSPVQLNMENIVSAYAW